MSGIQVGAAVADMTPPAGIAMAGGWRPKTSQAIATPLQAHTMALDDGSTRLAIVSLDLIVLPARDGDDAKERIDTQAGIAPENVLIACSHTHAAPYPTALLGEDTQPDPEYMARVRDAIVESVIQASERLEPAEIGVGAAQVPGPCKNRRRLKSSNDVYNTWMLSGEEIAASPPAGPVDDELTVLLARRPGGEPIAFLWNFSLHAHAFWKQEICADYPFYTAQKVEERIGTAPVFAFTAGACGDINRPRNISGPEIAEKLAAAMFETWQGLDFSSEIRLGNRFRPFETRLRDFSEFQEEEIARKLPSALEVARGEWDFLREHSGERLTTSLHAMRIGDLALACVPGEYFCALGLDIKKRSPFARTAVVELADDYVGYIPTSEAYDQGGYELFNLRSSKVERGTGERMADELVEMMNELGPS